MEGYFNLSVFLFNTVITDHTGSINIEQLKRYCSNFNNFNMNQYQLQCSVERFLQSQKINYRLEKKENICIIKGVSLNLHLENTNSIKKEESLKKEPLPLLLPQKNKDLSLNKKVTVLKSKKKYNKIPFLLLLSFCILLLLISQRSTLKKTVEYLNKKYSTVSVNKDTPNQIPKYKSNYSVSFFDSITLKNSFKGTLILGGLYIITRIFKEIFISNPVIKQSNQKSEKIENSILKQLPKEQEIIETPHQQTFQTSAGYLKENPMYNYISPPKENPGSSGSGPSSFFLKKSPSHSCINKIEYHSSI